MDILIDIDDLIPDELLNDLKDQLFKLYDETEKSISTEDDDTYSFGCCLYRRSFNAIKRRFKKSYLVEDLSANNKLILKVNDSSLYLRFLNSAPEEYKRKYNGDILKMFNIFDKPSFNLDLFEDNSPKEDQLFGCFYYEESLDSSLTINLKVFDQFWNIKAEWSSDSVQDISFDSDETHKIYPEAKLLDTEQLTPVTTIIPDKKQGS